MKSLVIIYKISDNDQRPAQYLSYSDFLGAALGDTDYEAEQSHTGDDYGEKSEYIYNGADVFLAVVKIFISIA
jgi:hypothetical protein